jgi:hypothetical protein
MNRALSLLALCSLLALADCGGGSGAGNASCRGILNREKDCGAWTGGTTSCHKEPETQLDQCIGKCLEESSCADVQDYACFGATNPCIDDCLFTDDFVCDNGQHIQPILQCDGTPDCSDGSDEDGCQLGMFRCDNYGQELIDPLLVCDGNSNCSTGKDEEDCGEKVCSVFDVGQAQ